ncbi:MAG: DUF2784 family protein [Gammaproteobacteria bacterium]|jgi:hypothetical protein
MPMQSLQNPDIQTPPLATGLTRAVLLVADRVLYLFHICFMLAIVVGWIPQATRMYNWYLIVITLVSWFGLGLVFGFGFCLLTDIQSRIRQRLVAGGTMPSFVTDVLERITGRELNPFHVEVVTQLVFYFSVAASFYANFAYRWV